VSVGAGVGDGEFVNQAFAVAGSTETPASNVAEARVQLGADPDFDCTDVIGKVFDDRNVNGVQDRGEPGLPGVRLATVNGLLITTDAEGRYHITCPMIPNADRGSNFILKLDTRSLPTGYRTTTANPDTVRMTRGKFVKLNFGASLYRVVRLDLSDEAFAGDRPADSYRPKLAELIALTAEKPSVLRLAYHGAEGRGVAEARLAAVRAAVERLWRQDRRRYRLTIEEEAPGPAPAAP